MTRDPVTPEPGRGSTLELPWQNWRRELTRDEQRAAFVHAYDANAMFLAAWGTVELGFGEPVHERAPRFDGRRVGLWCVPDLDKVRIPEELLPTPWLAGRTWVTTPTLARTLEVCDALGLPDPLISEAYLWPAAARYLRTSADRLRDARKSARAAIESASADLGAPGALERLVRAEVVAEAVRDIYRIQTGRFGMGGGAGVFALPVWGHLVRAQARVNLHRRLSSLSSAPFAIITDGLIFATDEPDPRAYAARIRLPMGDGLGQFRHVGSVMASAIAEALPDMSGAKVLAAIKASELVNA